MFILHVSIVCLSILQGDEFLMKVILNNLNIIFITL
jgi:hypothetical protein